MCRCWLRCWEDFYWNCIEEKFCYDETIANYNPEEDEYYRKKPGNGFMSADKLENNNSSPVCIQPTLGRTNSRTPTTISAGKIHEEDYRQIQTNAPILAPEIMSVFSNSQIFHEHHPVIKKSSAFPGVHGKGGGRETDSEKLLFRLEGNDTVDSASTANNASAATLRPPLPQIDVTDTSLVASKQFPSIREEDDESDEVILRPHLSNNSIGNASGAGAGGGGGGDGVITNSTPILNKRLRNVQSVPYFPFRPASENDIFSISGSMSQISMTPEIPSISYSTLPKHYEDTPTIEKYKESVSLYSIQTAQSTRMSQVDFSMPRYFRRSGVPTVHSVDNLSASVAIGSSSSGGGSGSGGIGGGGGGAVVFMHPGGGGGLNAATAPKSAEKSKRLKLLRTKLPPLSIHLGGGRERSKDKGIE